MGKRGLTHKSKVSDQKDGMVECKICGASTRVEFMHQILQKYSCRYYYCQECGYLRTEHPYWIEEAYSHAITAADTGLVQRNLALSKILSSMLLVLYGRHGRYLDFAGGYGLFTRLMRDRGFDFYWTDKYCRNLLARGFEANAGTTFTAITAFEVLEHVPDPVAFMTEAFALAGTRTIIFTTRLFNGDPPKPGTWWYYAFETGQHISFYQHRTLQKIAERLNLHCYSNRSIHLLCEQRINPLWYSFMTLPIAVCLFSGLSRFLLASKTIEDHFDMMRRLP